MTRLHRRLTLLTAALLVLAAAFVSVRAAEIFESSLSTQAVAVEQTLGRSVIDVIQKALSHDVPFDGLVGAAEYLETVKRDNTSVEYLIVTGRDGRLRYSTDLSRIEGAELLQRTIATQRDEVAARIGKYFDTAIPIEHKGQIVGWLHLGERANIVAQLLRDIAFDILTVLVVASLVAFELVRLLLAASFSTPLRSLHDFLTGVAAGDFRQYLARDFFGGIGRLSRSINAAVAELNSRARRERSAGKSLPPGFSFDLRDERTTIRTNSVENVRWPFFLLIFSESVSLSFFPIFVGQFYDPGFGLPRHVVIGIPIALFMLVWAIAMPLAGSWCDRAGFRTAFSIGAAITTVGLILTAFAGTLLDLLLWRSLTAIGYGMIYVTTQTYITLNMPPTERTRGMAMFLGSFFAGMLSGAAIGGILVDRLGFQMTFLLSALLSGAAGLYVLRFLRKEQTEVVSKKGLALTDFKLLLRNKWFAVITLLSAVPNKVVLAGFLYYSVPLYLKSLGHNQAATGRVMMAYGLAIILIGPVVAKFADRLKERWRFVMVGGYAAAIAMSIPLFVHDTAGAVFAVVGLGVAHAIGVSPQLTLIADRCGDSIQEVGQATTVGIFRLVERIGNITGPILLGVMIALMDFMGAFVILALFMFITTTLFTLLLLWFDRQGNTFQTA